MNKIIRYNFIILERQSTIIMEALNSVDSQRSIQRENRPSKIIKKKQIEYIYSPKPRYIIIGSLFISMNRCYKAFSMFFGCVYNNTCWLFFYVDSVFYCMYTSKCNSMVREFGAFKTFPNFHCYIVSYWTSL